MKIHRTWPASLIVATALAWGCANETPGLSDKELIAVASADELNSRFSELSRRQTDWDAAAKENRDAMRRWFAREELKIILVATLDTIPPSPEKWDDDMEKYFSGYAASYRRQFSKARYREPRAIWGESGFANTFEVLHIARKGRLAFVRDRNGKPIWNRQRLRSGQHLILFLCGGGLGLRGMLHDCGIDPLHCTDANIAATKEWVPRYFGAGASTRPVSACGAGARQ